MAKSATKQPDQLAAMRHSLAHVLAMAVLKMFPSAKLAIGPAIADGFYYDFDLPAHRFSPEDFAKIEAEMQKVVKENQTFEKSLKSRDEAKSFFEKRGQKTPKHEIEAGKRRLKEML